ncbi:Arabinogalactan peptide 12 [Striga hermonthica]|uniref:Arabinogalactan peptide 12 n=1 Tax=Striga hermonthica TaxID=68872 RepID=A0A9N7P3I4_STRHE|nr:Arabinogalactan peptide 12 [Striga hermonthica]
MISWDAFRLVTPPWTNFFSARPSAAGAQNQVPTALNSPIPTLISQKGPSHDPIHPSAIETACCRATPPAIVVMAVMMAAQNAAAEVEAPAPGPSADASAFVPAIFACVVAAALGYLV